MHYYNGMDAAKRIGINYKTLLRWIERGKVRPEEGKTPTGQLVISGDQVEAARKEVQRGILGQDILDTYLLSTLADAICCQDSLMSPLKKEIKIQI